MSTIIVVGDGIVGRRIARLLNDHHVIVRGPRDAGVDAFAAELSKRDVVVLAMPGEHAPTAAVLGSSSASRSCRWVTCSTTPAS